MACQWLQVAEAELLRISNKVRFIKAVIEGSLHVNNRKKSDIEADLEAQGFDRLPNSGKKVMHRSVHALHQLWRQGYAHILRLLNTLKFRFVSCYCLPLAVPTF